MTQQIIDTGLVANDGTGESLRNAFTAVNNNFANVWAAGPVDTQVIIYSNVVSTNVTNLDLRLAGNGIGTITVESTVVPSIDRVYDLGTPTKQYDSVYAQYYFGNGAFLTGISGGNGSASNSFSTISANGVNIVATSATDTLTLASGNNVVILGNSGTDTVSISLVNNPVFSGNITAGSNIIGSNVNTVNLSLSGNVLSGLTVTGNVTAPYFQGNGSQLTGVVTSLGGNLAANINTGIYNLYSSNGAVKIDDTLSVTGTVITTGGILSGGPFTTTANVTANYFIGDGSQLTNLPTGNYSNANVAAYLPTYTGNVSAGNVSTTGNIQGTYLLGNGSQLTGISASLSGNLSGNINTGIYNLFSSNGAVKVDDALSVTGTVTATGGLITPGPVATTANVTANYFIGDGSQLTNLPAGNYSNANVAAYLPIYTGNVAANNFIGNGAALTSITGANVSGIVANAVYATTATTADYATNSGQATYATLANSVAGANVIGTVATATLANTATAAGTAQYVTANAQANITSVGVLTSLSATGNITGSYILGNGSQLTGISASLSGNLVGNINTGIYNIYSTSGPVTINDGLSVTGTVITSGGLTTPGPVATTANITANYFIGDGSQLTNLPAGNYSNANVAAYLPTYTGNVAANNFIGNGAALTSITGANISGTVANATYALNANSATFATTAGQANYAIVANSVAGANVSGTVANATYALNSNTSNYTNQANIANVANSVAGANVSGTVANASYALNSNAATYATIAVNSAQANYANIANSVTGSNVVGIVANAAYAIIASSADTANTAGLAQFVTANSQANITSVGVLTSLSSTGNITAPYFVGNGSQLTGVVTSLVGNLAGNIDTLEYSINSSNGEIRFGNSISVIGNAIVTNDLIVGDQIATTGNITTAANVYAQNFIGNVYGNVFANILIPGANTDVLFNTNGEADATSGLTFNKVSNVLTVGGNVSAVGNISGNYILGNGSQLTGLPELYGNANVAAYLPTYSGNLTAGNISASGNINANAFFGNTASVIGNITTSANVIASYFVGNFAGNISGNLTVPGLSTQVIFNTDGSADATSGFTFDKVTNAVSMGGNASAVGNITASYFIGNGSQLTGIDATLIQNGNSNVKVYANANVTTSVNGTSNVLVMANTGAYVTGIVSATGNINTADSLAADTITSYTANANVSLVPNGTGIVTIDDSNGGSTGIQLGTPTAGALVSNAVTLTTSTSVTNGIAQLNLILGKLVPPSPPNFPGGNTLSITTATSSGRMTSGFTQTDNTPGANKAVTAGNVVSVVRGSSYGTNTINNTGPGDSGVLTAYLNGNVAGNVTFNTGASPSANGTYGGNLIISNNYDYNTANASIAAGFWYVFTARASGTVTEGWNEIYLGDSATGNTNTPSWYYDASAPGTPVYSNVTVTACATPSLSYSSTIPHYNSGTQFGFGFSVNKLSGDLYPNNGNLLTNSTAAGGAFQTPASVTYASANVTVPLSRNLYVSSGAATGNTTANIVASGFGSSTTGPSVTVTNSYNSASQAFTTALANTVLYKNGTSTAIDEANVVIGSTIGTGSGNAFRIDNPGTGNTPAYTSNASAFNSQTSTLQTYDSTVVGSGSAGVLKHDQTNYSTGYLPAGPNLSAGRSGTQYFTFKFVRTAVSKFDIRYTGTIAGMWVALPGSVIDSSSGANGWIDMSVAYGGAGYPGVNAPGNGSDGCAVGGVVTLNSAVTNSSKTCTFGTVSSSSTATNEIYVRIALTSGQSVTALTLQTASN